MLTLVGFLLPWFHMFTICSLLSCVVFEVYGFVISPLSFAGVHLEFSYLEAGSAVCLLQFFSYVYFVTKVSL